MLNLCHRVLKILPDLLFACVIIMIAGKNKNSAAETGEDLNDPFHILLPDRADVIKQIAGLSFIGLGIQPPSPEWGAMLSDGKLVMLTHPWIVFPPGLAIMLTVASLTLIGDGLRDALDSKMKK